MARRVELDRIIDGLECQSDESQSFLNKRTGEVVLVSEEMLRTVEDGDSIDDYSDWEQEQITIAREIIGETGDYIELPSKFDIHEYSIMEDFCFSLDDSEMRDILLDLIKGRGAFGRFKHAIHAHGIEDQWYNYRDNAFKEIAIEWCRENGIEFDTK
ncbi:MAG: UPF0158 family protein [Planctomycetota bacterium]|jgi:hypothetical protein